TKCRVTCVEDSLAEKGHILPEHTPSGGAGYGPPGQIQSEAADFTLINRAKAGEREAFGLLAQRHGKAVLNLINTMIWDRTVAEDLWQETFVRALENITTYEPYQSGAGAGQSFVSWLYRIAVNLTLDELRRRGRWRLFSWDLFKPRHAQELENEAQYDPPSGAPDASTLLESREDIQRVRQALAALPPNWRMILILREYQDLPYEEIAEILGVPLGTVRSRLARAREQLRLALLRETPRRIIP
ncbi:MAG TPA: sigma-70 family RNA polymerase sigma factor, partial [Candidatus Binatia bacterium]|nr:sigma-70 family RNA polymerase sigma factor [Candidatus Binatia bacterium]